LSLLTKSLSTKCSSIMPISRRRSSASSR
jgi:hypothetical protein